MRRPGPDQGETLRVRARREDRQLELPKNYLMISLQALGPILAVSGCQAHRICAGGHHLIRRDTPLRSRYATAACGAPGPT
jgi:hypothetical protein